MSDTLDSMKLANLISTAIGDNRTKRDFASLIGMNYSTLSRYLHCKYDCFPSVKVLKNIAYHSEGRVSLEELLIVCHKDKALHDLDTMSQHHTFKLINRLFSYLECLNLSENLQSKLYPSDHLYDFGFSIDSFYITDWNMVFFPETVPASFEMVESFYTKLLYQEATSHEKISVVVVSKELFESLKTKLPLNLNLNLSVILVTPKSFNVIEEFWLCKRFSMTLNIQERITLHNQSEEKENL